MPKSQNQKAKLLYLAKIFSEDTDESHGLTISQIRQKLLSYDITADRKTLYMDFEELKHFGMDIIAEKDGKNFYYKLASRDFELAELKLLVDSVQSSKFITEKKSESLIKKLESLLSRYDATKLQRQVLVSGRIKNMNESIYYNVDEINDAINQNCQIRFKYFQWNVKKQEELRHNGSWYIVSPWHLRWDDENYYLIGYDEKSDTIKHYRVDKMRNISIEPVKRCGEEKLKSFDPAKYTKKLFGMYSGNETKVHLLCENSMAGVFIDRFGKDIPMVSTDDSHFEATVDVAVSRQFLGWVISLGPKVVIKSPESVVDEMKKLIKEISALYP